MKILISENQLDFIQQNQGFAKNNSPKVFNDEVKKFLYCLMTNTKENISDYWSINGINKGDLYRLLKRYNIVNETNQENIDLEKPNIIIPKKNFDKKVSRVYYELFPDDEPGLIITEDGEGMDGGTSCGSVGGSYEVPLFGVQRRKFANQ